MSVARIRTFHDASSGNESRRIYRIGEFYKDADETLAMNGFAPYRKPGLRGARLRAAA